MPSNHQRKAKPESSVLQHDVSQSRAGRTEGSAPHRRIPERDGDNQAPLTRVEFNALVEALGSIVDSLTEHRTRSSWTVSGYERHWGLEFESVERLRDWRWRLERKQIGEGY
jgi:hypothetical protein